MKKLTLISAFLVLSSTSHATLEQLDNQALTAVTGQGGADISLQLRLNHDLSANPTADCQRTSAVLEYCRLAIAINNRYADGSYKDALGVVRNSAGGVIANVGRKQWLVFKGIQGTINIQEIKLDGTDLTYNGIVKSAIQLSFDPLKPIQFRNVGYQSLSIETDTVANEGGGNLPGYLAKGAGGTGTGAYVDGKYTTAGFDNGRETGFTGLNINGNLSIAGTLKIFSCDAGHPRC